MYFTVGDCLLEMCSHSEKFEELGCGKTFVWSAHSAGHDAKSTVWKSLCLLYSMSRTPDEALWWLFFNIIIRSTCVWMYPQYWRGQQKISCCVLTSSQPLIFGTFYLESGWKNLNRMLRTFAFLHDTLLRHFRSAVHVWKKWLKKQSCRRVKEISIKQSVKSFTHAHLCGWIVVA